jgi:hypothetical protein
METFMNVRGLLLGSAAAMIAASGARAADAIIIAEPEPMEYVRICDMYGAGFFYIPGTETCLQIGGYMRYRMDYSSDDWAGGDYRFGKFARFQLAVDARNETEWGTLRGYAEGRWEWYSYTWDGFVGTGSANDAYANQVFMELTTGMGTLRVGKGDNPYARFFDYYGADGELDGDYGGQIYNSGEVSFTFAPGNGFQAVIAAVEPGTGLFEPNIEVGAIYEQDWGSIGGIFGYDMPDDSWGAKAVARVSFDPVSLGVHVLYSSSESGVYGAVNPFSGETSEWSILGHVGVQMNDKIGANAYVQWFDETTSAPTAWAIKGGLALTPVDGLEIRPEVRYFKANGLEGTWEGILQFSRYF